MKTNEELFDEGWDKERGGKPLNNDHIPVTERQLYKWEMQAFLAACEIKDKEIERLQRELVSIIENNNYHANQMIKLKERLEKANDLLMEYKIKNLHEDDCFSTYPNMSAKCNCNLKDVRDYLKQLEQG